MKTWTSSEQRGNQWKGGTKDPGGGTWKEPEGTWTPTEWGKRNLGRGERGEEPEREEEEERKRTPNERSARGYP
jgi:hypothetical protein